MGNEAVAYTTCEVNWTNRRTLRKFYNLWRSTLSCFEDHPNMCDPPQGLFRPGIFELNVLYDFQCLFTRHNIFTGLLTTKFGNTVSQEKNAAIVW